MPSCSKAARGLFVLLRTDGIFTVNALSPSSSSRQYPYHYAIRAGQNFISEIYACFYQYNAFCTLYIAIEFGLYLHPRLGAWRVVSEGSP